MLGLMVNLRQQIKSASGRLVLCSMPPSLVRVFRTCCMERLFVIAKTRADAMKLAK
jgi:anti-anti-sigma regulatory factor